MSSTSGGAEATKLRAVIAAGGTAGHVAPALVIADELRGLGLDVAFLVSPRPLDTELVSEAGYRSEVIPVDGLPRSVSIAAVRSLLRAFAAVPRSMSQLRKLRPDVVVCGGGFVSAPVAVAAWLCRVPILATEADRHLGLANRVATLFARRFCVAYPLPQRRRKQVVTGRPVRKEFVTTTREQARAALGITQDARVLTCVGGSGGATRLSERIVDAFGAASDRPAFENGQAGLTVIHVTGRRDYEHVLALLSEAGQDADDPAYRVVPFASNMPELLAASDVVISRPGGTVFEIAAAGVASVLIPSPNVTGDHQTANASYFAERGAAVMLRESEVTGPKLRSEIASLFDENNAVGGASRRQAIASAMGQLSRPDAGAQIARIAWELAQSHSKVTGIGAVTEHSADPLPLKGQRMHLLGIGGAGVSGLARLVSAWGAETDGCDKSASSFTQRLQASGVDVAIGHSPEHISRGMRVVVSSALPTEHPELVRARELGCEIIRRGELLGSLTHLPKVRSVVVAGAHGKSTTTSMLGKVLVDAGLDPSVLVGADVPQLGGNARIGAANELGEQLLILEGDESDRTLDSYRADVAIITNIELDHHASYASFDELVEFFCGWVRSLGPSATLVLGTDPQLDVVQAAHSGPTIRFGADESELESLRQHVRLPGRHNLLNASAVAAACSAPVLNVPSDAVMRGLKAFTGLGRRYELVGEASGAEIRDDYAHHPTEVLATIQAARSVVAERGQGRVLIVFQPHLYSRTRELAERFGQALAGADHAWVLPIYGAREQPIDGVSSALIVEAARSLGNAEVEELHAGPATCEVSTIAGMVQEGDIVITMGAGDITTLAPRLVEALGP